MTGDVRFVRSGKIPEKFRKNWVKILLTVLFSGIIICKSAIVSKCKPKPRRAFDYKDFLPELLNPAGMKEREWDSVRTYEIPKCSPKLFCI